MTARSHDDQGNPVYFNGHHWLPDDGTPPSRPCPRCGQPPTSEGHDVCIKDLPGIEHACCGHGTRKPSLMFNSEAHFRAAIKAIRSTK